MEAFGRHLRLLTKLCSYSLLLLTGLRIAQLVGLTPDAIRREWAWDLVRAFWMGLRFDAKVVSILYLPLVIQAIGALVPARALRGDLSIRIARWYGFSILMLLLTLGVVNFFYYQFYQEPLGITAFGLVHDDTFAVLRSIWTDFPVVWVIVFLTTGALVLIWITGRWVRHRGWCLAGWIRIALAVALPIALFGLARGTLGDRPLGDSHSVVSSNMQINHLPMNAPMAAQYAWKKFKATRSDENLGDILKRNGFTSVEEALRIYLHREDTAQIGLDALLETIPGHDDTLALPHVLFLQMESMGSYYMRFDKEPFNLLGSLREELAHLLWFPRCVSAAGGTIVSMESILFGSPFRNISQTAYSGVALPYSAPSVYRHAGYTTWYITGQRLGWQNIFDFYSHQAFDHIEGDVDLLRHDSQAATGEWGVHDESLFKRIASVLEEAKGPQFIYGMTISHHTPYDVPQGEFAQAMAIPDSVSARIRCDQKVAARSFVAFHYAADALGRFLHELRNSAWGSRTIVAITGDHTLKQTLHFGDDPLNMHGVPVLYYIPSAYMPRVNDGKGVDTSIYASHHDILPTLYHLALGGGQYLKTGYSMLERGANEMERTGVYDNALGLNEKHYVNWRQGYFATRDTISGALQHDAKPTASQGKTIRWLQAREVCMAAFLMAHWQKKEL